MKGAHYSDCATNNGPALPVGACDCGGFVAQPVERHDWWIPRPEEGLQKVKSAEVDAGGSWGVAFEFRINGKKVRTAGRVQVGLTPSETANALQAIADRLRTL